MKGMAAALLFLCLTAPLFAQGKRLWVLREPGEMVEYDPVTFVRKQTVQVPPEALKSPQNLQVNRPGQMLFAAAASLPLREGDDGPAQNFWFFDGKTTHTLARGLSRSVAREGSNLAVGETATVPVLSSEGTRIYWFANEAHRLQRDQVDLSTRTTWRAWRTDLSGASREEMASQAFADCRCTTGSCEETCPYGDVWSRNDGVARCFLLTEFIAGQTQPLYKASFRYEEDGGKWTATTVEPPLHRILDAADADDVLEAIPDTGCCGWANQSDDQSLLRLPGKTLTVFDERASFNNPDYDVSFYTQTGKISPERGYVALTIVATTGPDRPIQLAEEGQADPQESLRIRKALEKLPAVEVESIEDPPRQTAYLPHARLVGWINEKEILVVENHWLVTYNIATGERRRSDIRVEDELLVFLR
ncbi:MAG TPA: hypothetical protein VMU61_06385 [Candidatus Aquilonibacter sp.]|nr:hypothetical protein [Candidatus Aquilonibacter sp.]